METTLWASSTLITSPSKPVSHGPSRSETRIPTSRKERECAQDHTIDRFSTLFRNRSSAKWHEIITIYKANKFSHLYKNDTAYLLWWVQFSSVTQSCPTICDPMNHSTPGLPVHHQILEFTHSCLLSRWCHPIISSSVVPSSSCPQSLPASGSFPMSQLFAWGGQSTGVSASASVPPMNTQDWSPLGWTGWISLQFKGLSRVFSNTTVQKHQFFGAQLSL